MACAGPSYPPIRYADVGVNLTDRRFGDDLEAVLQRARDAGVMLQIITGTTLDESRRALALTHTQPDLYATAGVHPHHARDWGPDSGRAQSELLADPRCVAVGETGLDFNRDFSPRPDQERAFQAQLELAGQTGKPVFLHQRDAHARFLPMLREARDTLVDAVVHCFTGNRRELFDYLDLDCHIGVTGWICDERRGQTLRELVASIPAERLLTETDSPYLLPRDWPEKPTVKGRNEPASLPWIVQRIAHYRGEDPRELARQTTANAVRFFQLTPPAPAP